MSVTTSPQKRRTNIVGGDQLQDGAVTFDKVEPDLLERIESTTLKAKANYIGFTSFNSGEIYIHGLVNGVDQNVDGYVFYGGVKYIVPKGPVVTQIDQEGYLVFSTAQDFGTRGLILHSGQSVIPAFVSDGVWYYDANDGTSRTFTPNPSTDIVIGYYRTAATDDVEESYIFKDPVPINEIVVTSRKILANAILAEHITSGEINTNHMTANSIDGDRITANTLSAEKITTSTLLADLTLSGSIKTSSTGARVEMDNLGIRAYNSGGTSTLTVNAANGNVSMVGSLTSGSTITGATITGGTIRTNTSPTTNGVIIDDANGFRAYSSGVLNAQINRLGIANFKNATITGTSSIDGAAGSVTFSVGSGSSIFRVDGSGLSMGGSSFATSPFRVGYDGTAILTKATLTGIDLAANGKIIDTVSFSVDKEGDVLASSITVNDGTIAGGTIDIGGSDATSFHVNNAGQMWMGASLYAAAPFRVSNTGALDIGGVDGTSFHIDNTGNMWSGDGAFASAPFSVSSSGALTASNVTITGSAGNIINTTNFVVSGTGAVTAASGVFNSGTINGTFSVNGALNVTGGSINLTSGDLNVSGTGDIKVSQGDVIVSSNGSLRSANYNAGTSTGWYLGPTGLDLNGLTLDAGSLQIGVSNVNLYRNSSFENGTTVATSWLQHLYTAGATYSIEDTDPLFQNKSQKILVTTSGNNAGVYQDVAFEEPLQAGESLTVSYWVKQTTGSARSAKIMFYAHGSSSTSLRNTSSTNTVVGSWIRVVDTYVPTTTISNGVRTYLSLESVVSGDTFFIDGAQMQKSSFVTDYQPAPLDIPDNYINSAHISTLSADKLTSGIIDAHTIEMAGSGHIQSFDWSDSSSNPALNSGYRLSADGVVFQNGAVTIVGAGGALQMDSNSLRASYGGVNHLVVNSTGVTLADSIKVTASSIESADFSPSFGLVGWQIKKDGYANFSRVTVRQGFFVGNNRVGASSNSSDYMASSNYVPGVRGWCIRANGDVEFREGNFRGSITGASGTFSGNLSAAGGTFTGTLSGVDGTFSGSLSANSGTLNTVTVNNYITSSTYNTSSGWRVYSSGAATFYNIDARGGTINGTLDIISGEIKSKMGSGTTESNLRLTTSGIKLGAYNSGSGTVQDFCEMRAYGRNLYIDASLGPTGNVYIKGTDISIGSASGLSIYSNNFNVSSSGVSSGPITSTGVSSMAGLVVGSLVAGDGTASSPGIRFLNSQNTGLSRTSSTLRFIWNGTVAAQFNHLDFTVNRGFNANSAVTFANIGSGTGAPLLWNPFAGGTVGYDSSTARLKDNISENYDVQYEYTDKILTSGMKVWDSLSGELNTETGEITNIRKMEPERDPMNRGITWERIGPIAEELYEVFPEAVILGKDGSPASLNMNMITFSALKALQELVGELKDEGIIDQDWLNKRKEKDKARSLKPS